MMFVYKISLSSLAFLFCFRSHAKCDILISGHIEISICISNLTNKLEHNVSMVTCHLEINVDISTCTSNFTDNLEHNVSIVKCQLEI